MKTDHQLKHDVMAELARDPAIRANAVGVAVGDGIVTLTGHPDTLAEKHAIEGAVRRVQGVQAVALELNGERMQHEPADDELAKAIAKALQSNGVIPAGAIRATVERGHVTLRGEVEWGFQRRSAEDAVRAAASGVACLSNQIALRPQTTTAEVRDCIEAALSRQARREARRIRIDVAGSAVTLSGIVRSADERDAAAAAAWGAPGVRSVVNELHVDA